MRRVAETSIFIFYVAEIWTEAERQDYIAHSAENPRRGRVGVVAGAAGFDGLALERGGPVAPG